MSKCPRCGVSRYIVKDDDECSSDENSKKGPLAKVLWYLSIVQRFKRLFANGNDAKDILHGMQMRATAMEWSVIRMIAPSGKG